MAAKPIPPTRAGYEGVWEDKPMKLRKDGVFQFLFTVDVRNGEPVYSVAQLDHLRQAVGYKERGMYGGDLEELIEYMMEWINASLTDPDDLADAKKRIDHQNF